MFLTKPKALVAGILALASLGAAVATRELAMAAGKADRSAASQQAAPAQETARPAGGDPGPADVATLVKRRQANEKQLREIALALWDHFDDNKGTFPAPAISSKDGKPLLSWRVAILPYLGEKDLFKRFKLEEPWDSDHNKQLLAEMPKIYAPVVPMKAKGVTYYQALVGEGAAFEPNKRMRLSNFNGMRGTIMVVEAAEAVPWTKPQDVSFAPDQGLPKLGGLFGGHFHAMFGDGSVQFVSKNADPKELRKAIVRKDGYVVDFDKLIAPIITAGVVDVDLLPNDIKHLQESIADANGEIAKAKQELEALTSKLAKASKVDAPTGKAHRGTRALEAFSGTSAEGIGCPS